MINANSFSITTPTSEFVKSHLTVGRNQREKKGCRVEIFYMLPQENSVLGLLYLISKLTRIGKYITMSFLCVTRAAQNAIPQNISNFKKGIKMSLSFYVP